MMKKIKYRDKARRKINKTCFDLQLHSTAKTVTTYEYMYIWVLNIGTYLILTLTQIALNLIKLLLGIGSFHFVAIVQHF